MDEGKKRLRWEHWLVGEERRKQNRVPFLSWSRFAPLPSRSRCWPRPFRLCGSPFFGFSHPLLLRNQLLSPPNFCSAVSLSCQHLGSILNHRFVRNECTIENIVSLFLQLCVIRWNSTCYDCWAGRTTKLEVRIQRKEQARKAGWFTWRMSDVMISYSFGK